MVEHINQGNSINGSAPPGRTAGGATPSGVNGNGTRRAAPYINLNGVNHFGLNNPTTPTLQSQVQQILGMKEAQIFKANVMRIAHIIRMRIIDVLRF